MPEDLLKLTREGKIGSFLHVLTVEEANQLQREAMKSRLAMLKVQCMFIALISRAVCRAILYAISVSKERAGALSLMTSHNEVNGVPAHTDPWLMTDVLRGEWGFKGFVVSDWYDIEHVQPRGRQHAGRREQCLRSRVSAARSSRRECSHRRH